VSLQALPQTDLRGEPGMILEDLLHDPHRYVCTSLISVFSLSLLAHKNGLNARALSLQKISCGSVIATPSPYALA